MCPNAAHFARDVPAQIRELPVLMTDEAGQYRMVGREFAGHGTVNHGIEEYVDIKQVTLALK